MHKFCKEIVCNFFAYDPSKELCTFLVFLMLHIRLFKIVQIFLPIRIGQGMVNVFSKCIFYHFLDILFANIFTILLDFANKMSIFANLIEILLQILKVEYNIFLMMYHMMYHEKIRTFSSQNTIHFFRKIIKFAFQGHFFL